ncbi:MAG TPA: hypothetical protein VLJ68_12480 [Chitinophagaceae bacterium]|nr:hypothetical protein [Chitinophagaceae bacterium]
MILAFLMLGAASFSQGSPVDSVIAPPLESLPSDTIPNYDELFQDFDAFMDSILSPHSYFLSSLSVGKGYFNFETKGTSLIETSQKLTYTPTVGYYNKGGLGITAIGYLVNDDSKLNFFQFSLSPSFDYFENRNFATGGSYTRYFTKKKLPFYTSPLQNELYAYFTYRKWWMKPSVSLSYGWGSRTDYTRREEQIISLRLRPNGFTYVNTKESIADFSVMTSVRHDFYWLDVFTFNDHIRFTPQIAFTSGTQKFGFNQSSNTYATTVRNAANVLYSSENIYLDDQLDFQPLSLALYLRGEYSIRKFFIQPQFSLDYYFPAENKNLTALFSINMGFMF